MGDGLGRDGARPRVLWGCAALVAVAILSLVGFVVRDGGGIASLQLLLPGLQRFEEQAWKDSTVNWKDPVRLRMVDDLLRRHPLVGLERSAVEQLLGPPLSPQPFGRGLLSESRFAPDPFIYHIGPDHLGLDSMWLAIEFDAGGRVSAARVVSD